MPQSRQPIWLHSDRFLARNVGRPFLRFLDIEASGGILLLASTVAALAWANSPWSAAYHDLWATEAVIEVGGFEVTDDLRHWINDGLMALFFFVVGLEIKQELVTGHLSTRRQALLPALAAFGGMAVPAVFYAVVNAGGEGSAGWGIPMATDIAFAVGVLTLLGPRVPTALKVMLLALAVVDDIGAIAVIAVFYSGTIDTAWALAALVGVVAVVVLQRVRVWFVPLYAVMGLGVWFATFESGIHATMAGVVLGLVTPARPLMPETESTAIADQLSEDPQVTVAEVREMSFRLRESVPVAERLQELLHPWTSYLVIPLFALANAGVSLSGEAIGDAATSPVTLGVVVGLLAGKVLGVTGAVYLATRLRVAVLPPGVGIRHVAGVGMLAGIGFTVSLFISALAFDDVGVQDQAKIGVLAASVLAATVGGLFLRAALPRSGAEAFADE
jgi:NhaA family Na+:H+ antiporter